MKQTRRKRFLFSHFAFIGAAFIFLFGFCGMANAFMFDTGNEDLQIRWDNTLKYNYGVRIENPKSAILANPNFNDGDGHFDCGQSVTNRLDILSELDTVFKSRYGFRVSGAFWYDQRYQDPLVNDYVATSNYFKNGAPAEGIHPKVRTDYLGPAGEILDAFAFGTFDLGPVPLSIRAGKHTLYWGEAFLFGGAINGVSYSQFPIDVGKAYAVPGSDIKELFRPRLAVSAQASLTQDMSLSVQQFLDYEPVKISGTGTYLEAYDMLSDGADVMWLDPATNAYLLRGSDIEPDGKDDWGVAFSWSPEFLRGKLGLYYRNFSDIQPQFVLDVVNGRFYHSYADDIDLYGISYSTELLGISISTEYAYRKNMPLNSDASVVTSAADLPDDGEVLGSRGETHHFVINFFGFVNKTFLWQAADYVLEFNYNRWEKVTQNEAAFLGRDGYDGIDRVSKDAWEMALSFNPAWYQVVSGVDLKMPISVAMGIKGNSALAGGAAKNAGNGSVGLSFDVFNKYTFNLAYNTYFGDFDTDADGAVSAFRGSGGLPLLSDRDWISFTFKTSF